MSSKTPASETTPILISSPCKVITCHGVRFIAGFTSNVTENAEEFPLCVCEKILFEKTNIIRITRSWEQYLNRCNFWKQIEKTDNIKELLLLLSGDVELNPGPPVFSKPQPAVSRNNDPRIQKLVRALERKDDKIKTLLKELRRSRKIRPQGIFDDIRNLETKLPTQETQNIFNRNLTKITDFLESTLPALSSQVTGHIANNISNVTSLTDNSISALAQIKEDIIKIVLIAILINILMAFKAYKTALLSILSFVCIYYKIPQQLRDIISELQLEANLKNFSN